MGHNTDGLTPKGQTTMLHTAHEAMKATHVSSRYVPMESGRQYDDVYFVLVCVTFSLSR